MFSSSKAIAALRLMVSIIFIIHAVYRSLIAQTVDGFGEFLGASGFPAGLAIAWIITLYEFAGGIAMALNKYVKFVAAGFLFHQVMGISLVHYKNGWFVVGGGTGGMEYSLLIMTSLLVILAKAIEQK